MVQQTISPESAKLTKAEIAEFEHVYHQLKKDLKIDNSLQDLPQTLEWLEMVMDYNVPHGKKVRGLMVPMTYKCLVKDPSTEDMKLAYVLGWCLEILQASSLVADDIMDASETRRGRPCWYKVGQKGVIAFNDVLILEHIVYEVLRMYFKDKSYHNKLVNLFLKTTYQTILGQSLDTQTGKERNLDKYTMERYSSIVKYKTSYYTIYLPVALTLAMTGINDADLWDKVEKISLEIGHIFQVQDDYLDCFGDVKVTGKIGTDIQDGKCSWLFVKAKAKCTPQQLAALKSIYGTDDDKNVEEVKALYRKIGLVDEYKKYEEESYENVCNKISEIGDKIPEAIFHTLLGMLYKRTK